MVTATLRKPAATVTVSPPAGVPAPAATTKKAPAKIIDVEATVTPQPAPVAAPVVAPVAQEPDLTALAGEAAPEAAVVTPAATEQPAEPAPAASAPVPRQPSAGAVAKYAPQQAEGFEGDWDQSDNKFPQLKIVQGSGPLSAQFDNGTIIYGDAELLPAPSVKVGAVNPVIRFIPINIFKQFREKLTDEQVKEGDMPRIFNSLAEVEDAGLTTVWVGSARPANYAEPSARMIILVEKPESSEHSGFALELDGKQYAVAVWYQAGGAFRDSAKVLYNTAKTSLLVPKLDMNGQPVLSTSGQVQKQVLLYRNFWTLAFVKKTFGAFQVWRPVVRLQAEQTSAGIREYCAAMNGDAAPAVAAAADVE